MKKVILFICISCIYKFSSAQKQVLFEKFTNAFCGVCPDATLNITEIVEDYPDVIWVSHHKPVTWTDNPLTNEKSIAIWNDLGVSGVPVGMIDRVKYGSSITLSQSQWRPRIIKQLDLYTAFKVDIDAIDYDANTRTLIFDVKTYIKDFVPEGPFRITAYIVEDSVNTKEQHSYWNDVVGHPLEGKGNIIWDYYHRNVVRTILEDHWGVADVVPIEPIVGETYTHTFTYIIHEEYKSKQIKLVAMVAEFDEVNNYPGEVHDAALILLKDVVNLTDTKEIQSNLISIYPNPTSDYLNLDFIELPEHIKILDQAGNLKIDYTPIHLNTTLDIQSLVPGNYFLVIESNGKLNGHVFSKVE